MDREQIIEEFYKMFDTVVNKDGGKINLLKENKVSHKSIVATVAMFIEKLNGEKIEPEKRTIMREITKPKYKFTIKGKTKCKRHITGTMGRCIVCGKK
jgi:hypothetical protein